MTAEFRAQKPAPAETPEEGRCLMFVESSRCRSLAAQVEAYARYLDQSGDNLFAAERGLHQRLATLAAGALALIDEGPVQEQEANGRGSRVARALWLGLIVVCWLALAIARLCHAPGPVYAILWVLPLPSMAWLTYLSL